MADSYGALIKTTTLTTGTNDYVLETTALTTPHRTPKQAVADGSLTDGDIVQYMARDTAVTGDASFELGEGVYTDASNEIARDAANVHDGSNGPGALVTFPGSGVRDIYLAVSPSNKLARIDRANAFTQNQGIGGAPGVTLDVLSVSSAQLRVKNSGTAQVNSILDSSPTTANANIGTLSGRWAGTFVSGVRFVTGADTVNEDDGYIILENTSGGSTAEVLRIGTATGHIASFSQDVIFGSNSVTPDGNLHIHSGSAGTVAADTSADELIVEGSGASVGMTILSPNTSDCKIGFGDGDSANRAHILYDHSSDEFKIQASATPAGILDSSGLMLGNATRGTARLKLDLTTQDLEIVDAGTVSATEDFWVEVTGAGSTFFLRGFTTK